MTEKLIGAHKLMKLCESGRLVAEQNASRSGAYRETLADAVENHRLHKAAYGVASRAYKLLSRDELKGEEFIDQAILYLEIVRDNFQGHAGDLAKQVADAEPQSAAPAEQAAEEQVASNVRALRGIRKLKVEGGVAAE
jgi:hypothetical protein